MDGPDWMAAAVGIPLAAAAVTFVGGARLMPLLPLAAGLGTALSVGGLVREVWLVGAIRYPLGGWPPPLGIEWRADGLSIVFLGFTAVVALVVGLFAAGHLPRYEMRQTADRFWPPFLFLWGSLNALYVSGDIFNLYVTLEFSTLAALVLVTSAGKGPAIGAGLRYLLIAQVGSLSYLIGVGMLYAGFGALDIDLLDRRVTPTLPALAALVLMTTGLLAKSAFFPLHVWLPPAHATAPSPASALLSGLVVKAPYYVLLRLWLDLFDGIASDEARNLLGLLGAAAVVWGSLQALLQERLKLLIAYSTVAQLGYLLLVFPLWPEAGALLGVLLLAAAHACAKSALFLAAGLILGSAGHDRILGIGAAAERLPLTVFAMGIAGLSVMGLPPSGGFTAKWLLIGAAFTSGQWWWGLVPLGGGLLTAAYVFTILQPAFKPGRPSRQPAPVPRRLELTCLALAMASIGVGFLAVPLAELPGLGGVR